MNRSIEVKATKFQVKRNGLLMFVQQPDDGEWFRMMTAYGTFAHEGQWCRVDPETHELKFRSDPP